MSPIYTPGKVVLRKTWQPMDADAAAYITAVETADGQALEEKVKIAIDNFVLGCKADGIWSAIKASCILAGARTLAGALVPLVGTAPTNVGSLFGSGDYNRKTGLAGNGSNKYLDANRASNADPQNNHHLSAFVTSQGVNLIIGSLGGLDYTELLVAGGNANGRSRNAANNQVASQSIASFHGVARSASTNYTARKYGLNQIVSATSQTPTSTSFKVFARGDGTLLGTHRIAFYSIGESLDLALLDARVTDLINAFGVAIP
jgi:hypothetical protein